MNKKTIKTEKAAVNFCIKEGLNKEDAENFVEWCYWQWDTEELSIEKLKKEIQIVLEAKRWARRPLWKKILFNKNKEIRGTPFCRALKEIYLELALWAKHTFSKENIIKHRKEIMGMLLLFFIILPLVFALIIGFAYLLWMAIVYSLYYFVDIYYPDPLPFSFCEVSVTLSICLFIGLAYSFFYKKRPQWLHAECYDGFNKVINFIVFYFIILSFLCIAPMMFLNIAKNEYIKDKTEIISSTD
jgi:hypothetical protein